MVGPCGNLPHRLRKATVNELEKERQRITLETGENPIPGSKITLNSTLFKSASPHYTACYKLERKIHWIRFIASNNKINAKTPMVSQKTVLLKLIKDNIY